MDLKLPHRVCYEYCEKLEMAQVIVRKEGVHPIVYTLDRGRLAFLFGMSTQIVNY